MARIPLALAFPFAHRRRTKIGIVLGSALTDLLDGWWARRHDAITAAGAVVDPICDKVFVASVLATLTAEGRLGPMDLALLGVRELGELPLALWLTLDGHTREAKSVQPAANAFGKIATVLQFATIGAALVDRPRIARAFALATGAAGAAAALAYAGRFLAEPA